MHPVMTDIRLVVFDLDGTLIDSVPDLARAVDAALGDLNLPAAGEATVRDWVGNGSLVLMERALHHAIAESAPGAATSDSGGASDIANEVAGLLARAHDAFLAHYAIDPASRTRLYPGVRQALDALRASSLPLALVTNKPSAFIAPILEGFGLQDHFVLCLGGDSLSRKKPDPAPLLHVAAHFDIPPNVCLMVGDSRHDIVAGKAAGFRTLAVPYGYNHGEPVADSGPDAVVESLAELV